MSAVHGPERLRGQGLDHHQEESGNRAIHALLTDPVIGDQVDLVLTWREATAERPAAYEVWSRRGMVRFRRVIADDGALGWVEKVTSGASAGADASSPLHAERPRATHAAVPISARWRCRRVTSSPRARRGRALPARR